MARAGHHHHEQHAHQGHQKVNAVRARAGAPSRDDDEEEKIEGSTLLDLLQGKEPQQRDENHTGSTVLDILTRKKERLDSITNSFYPYNTERYDKLSEEMGLARKGAAGGTSQPQPQSCIPGQQRVLKFYKRPVVQLMVALLIGANFFVSALHAQILPRPREDSQATELVFHYLDLAFTLLFTIELMINMYGSWFSAFWRSGWNWFDFVVVTVSLLALFLKDLPGVNVLRLLRAFRVLRLFKRIGSLKVIIEGVIASMPGVLNTFAILVILMGIWAIIGVQFFADYQPDHFGHFTTALFTMWQVTTMDGWSDVARDLIYKDNVTIAGFYFVSYTFISGIVMTNVVVAVLLESYLTYAEEVEAERKREELKELSHQKWGKAKSMANVTAGLKLSALMSTNDAGPSSAGDDATATRDKALAAELEELEQEEELRGTLLTRLKGKVGDVDDWEAMARREEQVAQREAALAQAAARKDAELAEREAEATKRMGQREVQVAKREADVGQREAAVAELMARREAEIAQREAVVAQREAALR